MDELLRQGLAILRGMWQRRWIGLAVAWVALAWQVGRTYRGITSTEHAVGIGQPARAGA